MTYGSDANSYSSICSQQRSTVSAATVTAQSSPCCTHVVHLVELDRCLVEVARLVLDIQLVAAGDRPQADVCNSSFFEASAEEEDEKGAAALTVVLRRLGVVARARAVVERPAVGVVVAGGRQTFRVSAQQDIRIIDKRRVSLLQVAAPRVSLRVTARRRR